MENEQMSYGDIANITELWEKQKNKTPNSAMAFSEKISKNMVLVKMMCLDLLA